jgi:hypothetical protein
VVSRLRSFAIVSASKSATSCVVNAGRRDADLDAGARRNVSAVCRTIELNATLQIASVECGRRFRVLSAASVSACLAGLRHHDHQRAGIGHAVAITIFARDLDLEMRTGFDPLLRDQARVVARPQARSAPVR